MNMKKLSTNHTTVILLLINGEHITTQWNHEVSSEKVWTDVRDSLRNLSEGVYVNEMFLACGVQSLRYTRGEVIEIAEQYS
jgi:hypothetical protein